MDIANMKQSGAGSKKGKGKRSFSLRILWLVVLIVVVALAIFFFTRLDAFSGASQPLRGRYQAVFLLNGQVYFGKLAFQAGDYAQLSEIYYFQTNDVPGSDNNLDEQFDVRLVKLGSEFHQPEDTMFINKNQILFYENLTENSRVTQAIQQFENGESL